MTRRRSFVHASLAASLLGRWAVAGAADSHDAPYTRLATPHAVADRTKIEVIEFFWYGCTHCRQLEPALEAWEAALPADVHFRREHVVWDGRPSTALEAKLFATLRTMSIVKVHQRAVFEVVQDERADLSDDRKLAAWVDRRGIDRAKFDLQPNGAQSRESKRRDPASADDQAWHPRHLRAGVRDGDRERRGAGPGGRHSKEPRRTDARVAEDR